MKKAWVSLIFVIVVLGAATVFLLKFDFKREQASEHKYEHDLAIMNKSFKRDLERSVILYKSFEKYFLGAESVPFVIVIPAGDWDLFMNRFKNLKDRKEIENIPQFITEQEVFERCNEPDISSNGGLAQQAVKLCFGSTRIAKNYIMMDSDNYFIKEFDPKILFKGGVSKTFSWKLPESYIEKNKIAILSCCINPIMRNNGQSITHYDMHVFIKDFFGNKKKEFYGFVMSPFVFNSDALARMKKWIDKKGGYKIATLIRLMPFEMQWYGEYMLQHENFIPMNAIFTLIESPDHCYLEDGGDAYGFTFQAIIYDYVDHQGNRENSQLVYKRPAHCDK